MKNKLLFILTICLIFHAQSFADNSFSTVSIVNNELPLTTFNITFNVGSANDPKGLEGIAHLTGNLLREGGVEKYGDRKAMTRSQIEEFLFPLSSHIEIDTEKEQTSIQTMITAENAESVFDLLSQMVLAPAFNEDEFDRLKSETFDALQKQWPREDQEELGKFALDRFLYGKTHPYSHIVEGTLSGLKLITLDKLKEFYRNNFVQERLTVGIGGVQSGSLKEKIQKNFSKLPLKAITSFESIPSASSFKTPKLLIVKGPFEATGVHIGISHPYNRKDDKFAHLYLVANAFGKHRSFVGRLMNVVREQRGINYGTYAYAEDFPHGGHLLTEATQVARTKQAFTMWGRPSTLDNGCFLLRQMAYEYENLKTKGLSEKEYKMGKSHLMGFVPILGTEISRQVGYAIDTLFYGVNGDYLKKLKSNIEKSNRNEVNKEIRNVLNAGSPAIVVVTKDPEKFKTEILSTECPVHYPTGVSKSKEIMNEDIIISRYSLGLKPENIEIISSEVLFN